MTSHELARWLLDNEDVPVMRWDQEYSEYFPVAVSAEAVEQVATPRGEVEFRPTRGVHKTEAWLKVVVVE